MDALTDLLGRSGYLPHGYCFTWSPALLWAMVGADAAIAAAYFSIPLAIVSFVRRRADASLHLAAGLFSAFIFACGITHLMDIWTIWQPDYGLQTLTKLLAATISMVTAVVLWQLIPKALKIPSVAQLQSSIDELKEEIRRRKSTEEHLVNVQQSLAVTLASIDAGFIATDRDGRVTHMNAVAERVTGWVEADAIGQNLWNVFDREERPAENTALSPVEVMLRDGVTVDTPYRVRSIPLGGGTATELEVKAALTYGPDGGVRGIAMVFRDMNRQVAADIERERAEQRFRLLFDAAPNAMLMAGRNGIISLVNREAELLFGYSRDELVGQPLEILIPERFRADHPGHARGYFAAPTSRAMGTGRDLFGRGKDGGEVPIEIGLSPLETPEGLFTLASIINITERRKNEGELRRSNAELEQFAYIASHDLQEPLRMVASYTDLLAQRYKGKLDARADKYIFYAVDGAKRMQRLVSDLLEFSRVGSEGKPLVRVATGTVVAAVLAMLSLRIREQEAVIETAPLPEVLGDEGQLRQLFQNLIGNAIKFRGEAAPRVRIEAQSEAGRWRFSVADNGIGIEAQYAERVFQMFQRLNERDRYEGSGIGLSIARKIVERHGGKLWFESTPGSGTAFFFTLAAAPDAPTPV